MRRRCFWCCRTLRWWQLNACRQCGTAFRAPYAGPPTSFGARAKADK